MVTTDIDAVALDAFKTFAHEATKTLTGLTGGGSEWFGKCVDGVYLADLPACERRIREKFEFAHKARLAALASAQPAQAGEYEGHTPSPWHVEPSIYEHMAAEIVGERGIAQVWNSPRAMVDARLIAAAPGLLARAEAAEARALAAEQRLATCTKALRKGLWLAVAVLAFLGRDRGTNRQEKTLDGLQQEAVKADAVIRAALSEASQ